MLKAKYFDKILLIFALILMFCEGGVVFGQDDFVIVALPDTQKYVLNGAYPEIFTTQTQWIANNVSSMNIVFVTHEGDIVDTWDNQAQWTYANNSMSVLDGVVPYGVSPGNHDMDTSTRRAPIYNSTFPYTRFDGGHYDDEPDWDNNNNYQLISAGGVDLIILQLEYNPRSNVITWADGILKDNPNRIAIITTHAFLNLDGSRLSEGAGIWNTLVQGNDNVCLVLCGHMHGEARRTDVVNGREVHQLLADYQTRSNGGNGWLRIMRFVPTEDMVYVETYSPSLDQYETDGDSQFSLHLVMGAADDVNNVANSDIPVKGTIAGSYTDTQSSDNVYETITERLSGGKPSNRYSYLEHKWTFNVSAGDTATFNVEAYKTADGDGDNFILAYSTDDYNYYDLLMVSKTIDDDSIQSCPLPVSTAGTVYIRVKDTNQIPGSQSLDSVIIDRMYIRSAGQVEPDTVPPTPNPMTWDKEPHATGSTSISMTAIMASDPSGVEYHFACTSGGGNDSGWQDSPYYEDTGLTPNTEYGYRVQARDKSPNNNVTDWSVVVSDYTMPIAGDSVIITKAEYRYSNSELNVEATSSSGGEAELRVYDGGSDTEYGVMTYDSRKDIYTLKIRGVSEPGDQILVISSLDGMDFMEVTKK
jgi:hypothetical protein